MNQQPTTANRPPATDDRDSIKLNLALEVLEAFGEARIPVTGASMLPALWPGDVLTVQSVRGQGIDATAPGDLVLARGDGRLVAHRVVERLRARGEVLFLTRGDRLDRADPPVAAEDLLGRVTAITRGDRSISLRQTLAGRVAAWVLRRSDFATRSVMYLHRAKSRKSPGVEESKVKCRKSRPFAAGPAKEALFFGGFPLPRE